MLHRDVGVRVDAGVRLQGVAGSPADQATHTGVAPAARARGPLGRSAMRLLGIDGRQAWQAATIQATEAMFGPAAANVRGTALAQAWLAARSMPTPSGAYRATII